MSQIYQNHNSFYKYYEDGNSITFYLQENLKNEEEDEDYQYLHQKNTLFLNQSSIGVIYEPEYFLNFDEENQCQKELLNKEEVLSFNKQQINEYEQQNINYPYIQTNQLNQQLIKENEQFYFYAQQSQANFGYHNLDLQNNFNNNQQNIQPLLKEVEEVSSETNFQKNEQINSQSSIMHNYQQQRFPQTEQNILQIVSEKSPVNQCDSLDINSSEQVESNELTFEMQNKNQRNQNHFKNIFNAFKKYMKQMKSCGILELSSNELSNLKKQLMRYMKLHSFNNTLLKYIINHKQYKLLLQDFLVNEGQNWITNSKIQDKDEVLKKTSFLIQCIKNPSHLDSLNTYQTNKFRKDQF